jgi:hypothetical protein
MKLPEDAAERVVGDFGRAELGDPRRTRRAQAIAMRLTQRPNAAMPVALDSEAEIEGAYRFARNEHVTFAALHQGHAQGTAQRAQEAQRVLVLHDTTSGAFPELDPADVGYLPTGKAGFLIHLSLVLDASRWRLPLGVVACETIHRSQRSRRKARKKASGTETAAQKDRESARWWRGIESASKALKECTEVIHVADRESDSYELMHRCIDAGHHFIFRVRVADRRGRAADRGIADWSTIRSIAHSCEGVLEREVELSGRAQKSAPGMNRGNPARPARTARLHFAATRVEIPRPQYVHDPVPKTLAVNLIHVRELNAPNGQAPIEWLLYTTEPIETAEQVAAVVDRYRARWTIEELNAALKTGCAYESRQFESRHALLNILALSLPIACELIALRSRCRDCPDAPASEILRPAQIEVLRTMGRRRLCGPATVRAALLAVAGLGGHMKGNGEPGWIVLMRGMRTLLEYEEAWLAGRESALRRPSDQTAEPDL